MLISLFFYFYTYIVSFYVFLLSLLLLFFFFKQKTAYEMRISDWSSDVCSSDLLGERRREIAVDAHDLAGRAHLQPKHRIDAGETGEGKNRFLYGDMAKVAVIDLKVPEGRERLSGHHEIGRAACRERVCQYV